MSKVKVFLAWQAQCEGQAGDQLVGTHFSADEHARCQAISHPQRRASYCAGHWLLRYGLSQCFTQAISCWDIRQPDGGALTLTNAGYEETGISLSHSHGLLACAINPHGAVGIDIEKIKPRPALLQMAEDEFSAALKADFHLAVQGSSQGKTQGNSQGNSQGKTEPYDYLFRHWCAHESRGKFYTTGLDLNALKTLGWQPLNKAADMENSGPVIKVTRLVDDFMLAVAAAADSSDSGIYPDIDPNPDNDVKVIWVEDAKDISADWQSGWLTVPEIQ